MKNVRFLIFNVAIGFHCVEAVIKKNGRFLEAGCLAAAVQKHQEKGRTIATGGTCKATACLTRIACLDADATFVSGEKVKILDGIEQNDVLQGSVRVSNFL